MDITRNHLNFLQEAIQAFEKNDLYETYRGKKDDGLIALRRGMGRDCIEILEIGEGIGFFAQMINRGSNVHFTEMYQELRWFSGEMQKQLNNNEEKSGWLGESWLFLFNELEKNYAALRSCTSKEEFQRRAVNIANFAMMIADKRRRLG